MAIHDSRGERAVAETIEQQQARAVATARMRAAQAGSPVEAPSGEMSDGDAAVRGLGLGARAMGPVAVGAAAGAAMGAPIGGVGAIPGAAAGASAMALIQMIDKLGGTNYIEKAMDALGLPKPVSDTEKIASGAMEGVAGMAGVGGAASTAAKAFPKSGAAPVLEAIAGNPGTAAVASAGGGAAQEVAKQGGADETGQLAANIGGSVLAPVAMGAGGAVASAVGRKLGDVGHAIGAAAGSQASARRLAADAVESLTKTEPVAIRRALENATEEVGGAKPTVAEALAEANLKTPTKQIGGELTKLQDSISGHRGVADVLPSKMKENQAAIETYLENLSVRTGMLRDEAFRNARNAPAGPAGRVQVTGKEAPVMGVDPIPVQKVIAYALQDRTIAGHSVARQLLQSVAMNLKKVPRHYGQNLDPEIMQGVRMDAAKALRRIAEKEKASASDAVSMRALKQVQGAIDDTIEASAPGWKLYMRMHSEGMKPVDTHIERLAAAEATVKGIQATGPEDLVKSMLPSLPTLLHRPTMVVNLALKLIGKDATEPFTRELANRLADPKGFLELMNRNAKMPVRKRADDILIKASVLANLIQKNEEAEKK